MIGSLLHFIIQVLKFLDPKMCESWDNFQLLDFDCEYLSNESMYWHQKTKKHVIDWWWTKLEFRVWFRTYPNVLFMEDHILACR